MSSEMSSDNDFLSVAQDLSKTVLVAFRQGIFFGIETRIPYAFTSILRPMLFNKPSRPIKEQLKFFADQTLAHGFIIARIAIIFKLTERFLFTFFTAKSLKGLSSSKIKPLPWQTFAAGALAGYLIMAFDTSYSVMKKQINMAIGIRTIYAVCAYAIRNGIFPFNVFEHSEPGYDKGTAVFYTVMWGLVMWHWRHHSVSKGEMNIAQVKQMDFIYNDFDLSQGWLDSTYIYWLVALIAAKNYL